MYGKAWKEHKYGRIVVPVVDKAQNHKRGHRGTGLGHHNLKERGAMSTAVQEHRLGIAPRHIFKHAVHYEKVKAETAKGSKHDEQRRVIKAQIRRELIQRACRTNDGNRHRENSKPEEEITAGEGVFG